MRRTDDTYEAVSLISYFWCFLYCIYLGEKGAGRDNGYALATEIDESTAL